MRPAGDCPARVLVLWCPDWPAAGQDAEARAFEQGGPVGEGVCPPVGGARPRAVRVGGRGPGPRGARPVPADLSVSAESDPPARLAEPVVFAAKALAERMHAGLAIGGFACVRVQVEVTCEDGRQITRLWRHDGLLTALAVAERVRWQLAGWQAGRDAAGRDGAGEDGPGEDGAGKDGPGEGGPGGDGIEAGGSPELRPAPDPLGPDGGRPPGPRGAAARRDPVARAAPRAQPPR